MASSNLEIDHASSMIRFTLTTSIEMRSENDLFYASCPWLDVHGQGETEHSAKNNLIEALQLFIGSCYERGVLEKVLADCGLKLADSQTSRLSTPANIGQKIDVPVDLSVTHNVRQAQAC